MVTSATLEQLARDTLSENDPEIALRALGALREELTYVEPQLVQRALRAGASWSRIARALGVSKQAAHRKYRDLAKPTADLPDSGHRVIVTSEARRSVALAREEAKALGVPSLGTEHLLLGILRCRRSHAVTALNTLGVTYEAAVECLRTTMPGVVLAGDPTAAADSGISPHARRILEGSLREALKHGDGYIGVEHLLLALLTDSRNGAVQTLEQLKVTSRQVRDQLEREWALVVESSLEAAAEPGTPSGAEIPAS